MRRAKSLGSFWVVAAAACVLLFRGAAQAQTYTWVGNTGTNKSQSDAAANREWTDAANWNLAGFPNAPGVTAGISTGNDQYLNLAADVTVGGLNFSGGDFGIYGGSDSNNLNRLILNNNGSGVTVNLNNNWRLHAQEQSLVAPWVLDDDVHLRFTSGAQREQRLPKFTGTGHLTVEQVSVSTNMEFRFVHESTHSGGTTLIGSRQPWRLVAENALGGGLLTLNGGARVDMRANQTVAGLAGTSTSAHIFPDSGTRTLSLDFDNTAGPYTYVGEVRSGGGTLNLVKGGTGTQIFSGANTYTGTTIVDGGTLLVNGTHTGGGLYTVNDAGTLGGTGSISAAVDLLGTVSPGASIGTLASGTETWYDAGNFLLEIDDAAGTAGIVGGPGWDLLDITGTLELGSLTPGGFTVDLVSLQPGGGTTPGLIANFDPLEDYLWEFVTTTGGVNDFEADSFVLDTSGFSNSTGGGMFSVVQTGSGLAVSYTGIPEPSTCLLALFGTLGVGLFGSRRRKSR